MTRDEIITGVKARMDELTLGEEEAILYVGDNIEKPLYTVIDVIIDECGHDILRVAPLHLCPRKSIDPATMTINIKDKVAYIPVPSDFLRLAFIQFINWERPVTKTITIESLEYLLQKNKFTRGGLSKPVVAITNDSETGEMVLECYTVGDLTVNDKPILIYVRAVTVEEIGDILLNAVMWHCASKVLNIMARLNESVAAEQRATEILKALMI